MSHVVEWYQGSHIVYISVSIYGQKQPTLYCIPGHPIDDAIIHSQSGNQPRCMSHRTLCITFGQWNILLIHLTCSFTPNGLQADTLLHLNKTTPFQLLPKFDPNFIITLEKSQLRACIHTHVQANANTHPINYTAWYHMEKSHFQTSLMCALSSVDTQVPFTLLLLLPAWQNSITILAGLSLLGSKRPFPVHLSTCILGNANWI